MKVLEKNESTDLAVAIMELCDSKKAENIVMFDITKLSSIANYMVSVTVSNTTMSKAIADYIEESLNKVAIRVLRRDGVGEWIVLDYNEVIVHIFTAEVRDYYHLEKLWGENKNAYSLEEVRKILEKEEEEKQKEEKKKTVTKQKKDEKASKQTKTKKEAK
ncbi:MAG: ribosome silencing factor [Clostridia bacterium]|nr:ribosome silencing factor [Clostridia bacterium]